MILWLVLTVFTTKDMISTRLRLVSCDLLVLQAAISGNEALAKLLQVEVLENWSEYGAAIFEYSLKKLEEAPYSQPWWSYLIIHQADNTLIGTCGYKGPPTDGTVEIGYEIALPYRRRGLATEVAGLLRQNATEKPEIRLVQAHTLANPNASTRVLEKNGFQFVEELETEEGKIWKWEYWT